MNKIIKHTVSRESRAKKNMNFRTRNYSSAEILIGNRNVGQNAKYRDVERVMYSSSSSIPRDEYITRVHKSARGLIVRRDRECRH